MKGLLFVTIIVLFSTSVTFAEDIDVVYFQNGSVIKGNIIEQVINESIKIELQDGSIMVFDYDQIVKIEKAERLEKNRSTKISSYTGRKSPGVALILSLIVFPGIGQFYNEEIGKGVLHFLAGALSAGIMLDGMQEVTTYEYDWYGSTEITEMKNESAATLGAVAYLTTWIVSSVDAYSSAKRINQTLAFKEDYGFAISFFPNKVNLSYRF